MAREVLEGGRFWVKKLASSRPPLCAMSDREETRPQTLRVARGRITLLSLSERSFRGQFKRIRNDVQKSQHDLAWKLEALDGRHDVSNDDMRRLV